MAGKKKGSGKSKKKVTADIKERPEKTKKKEVAPPPKSLSDIVKDAGPEKIEALSRNLTEAMMQSQELLREMTLSNVQDKIGGQPPSTIDPFAVNEVWSRVGTNLARHPERIFNAQLELWEGHVNIWRSLLVKQEPDATARKDRKFSDPEWDTNPMFEMIRKTYELNSQWLLSLVSSAEEIDDATKRKASFFAKQAAEAFSPTNFFATNPTALRRMLETGGESVVEGLRLAREDMKRGHGKLLISQTDGTPFAVGENIATAKGEVVYRNELMEIIQYAPTTEKVYERPLLFFPPWINKFYILDLRVENSMIRWLVDQGVSVFVVSWRSADKTMSEVTWDDYVRLGAYDAVEQVCRIADTNRVNTVGYCIGGTMLASALARMAIDDDDRINSATFFASQSDFVEAGELLIFTDDDAIDYIETLIDRHDGIMAGDDMAETFNYLRPSDLVWRYVVDNYMLGKKPRPFDLLYWNSDQTNIPGPTHLTYLRDLYGSNALAAGNFEVLGETVSLGDIKIPAMFQASKDDHIAPYPSVYRSARAFGGDVEFVMAGSGHIAGVINHPDAQKYQHWTNKKLPETPDQWIDEAEEHPGSWWPYWLKWLERKSGRKVAARIPKDVGLGPAPGKYVQQKLEHLGIGPSAN